MKAIFIRHARSRFLYFLSIAYNYLANILTAISLRQREDGRRKSANPRQTGADTRPERLPDIVPHRSFRIQRNGKQQAGREMVLLGNRVESVTMEPYQIVE